MNLEDVKGHVLGMLDSNLIAVDTETTGLDVKTGKDYLIGISVAYRLGPLGIFTAYFPLRHESDNLPVMETVSLLAPVFQSKPLVFHNRKFDLHSLATIGITKFDKPQYDTMLEAHLWNEELPSKELDYLSRKFIDSNKLKDEVAAWAKMFGWATVPVNIMAPYACRDAELTLRLHEFLWPKLEEEQLVQLWDSQSAFTSMLYGMERQGVGVNAEFCRRKAEQGRDRMDTIERSLGFCPSKTSDLARFFFDELKLPVLDKTPAGKPSLSKKVMEEYDSMLESSNNEAARLVLEYRGWQKAVTSLYEPMLLLADSNMKIHANFKQTGTVTGRLSCEKPNLQQIPRKSDKEWNGDARQAFWAGDDDFELIGYDYSQLELRLAASYGDETRLLQEFEKEESDPFTAYSKIIGVSRQETKTFFYANIYGAGVSKIASTLGRSVEETTPLHDRFIESIPGITRAAKRATQLANERGFVRYWTGRRRHFPYREETYRAFNSILQGGAAELVMHAMLKMRELEGPDLRVVLQIHDEIVFKVRRDLIEKYDPEIRYRMTDFPQFGVRFAVESKVWNR